MLKLSDLRKSKYLAGGEMGGDGIAGVLLKTSLLYTSIITIPYICEEQNKISHQNINVKILVI